jgi:hypothetical protein
MIKYQLTDPDTDKQVFISIDSDDPDVSGAIKYSGDAELIKLLELMISSSYGAFGHSIGDSTTPIDLDAALTIGNKFDKYNPEILEGEDLVKSYESNIPDGAMT